MLQQHSGADGPVEGNHSSTVPCIALIHHTIASIPTVTKHDGTTWQRAITDNVQIMNNARVTKIASGHRNRHHCRYTMYLRNRAGATCHAGSNDRFSVGGFYCCCICWACCCTELLGHASRAGAGVRITLSASLTATATSRRSLASPR